MSRNDEHRVGDMLDAADKLAARLSVLQYATWVGDEDMRLITERLVEIVGEAARAMSPEGRAALPGIDWAGLVGLRTVLVHAYRRVQPQLLWQAATVDLPMIAAILRARCDPADGAD